MNYSHHLKSLIGKGYSKLKILVNSQSLNADQLKPTPIKAFRLMVHEMQASKGFQPNIIKIISEQNLLIFFLHIYFTTSSRLLKA
jgi:hypothetical protein